PVELVQASDRRILRARALRPVSRHRGSRLPRRRRSRRLSTRRLLHCSRLSRDVTRTKVLLSRDEGPVDGELQDGTVPAVEDFMRVGVLLPAAIVLVFATACATTDRVAVTRNPTVCAFLGDNCDQMTKGGEGQAGLRWINPNAKLIQYNKVM